MTSGLASLIAAAAMLAAGCGALGFPEARAPRSDSAHVDTDCSQRQASAPPPSAHVYEALMP